MRPTHVVLVIGALSSCPIALHAGPLVPPVGSIAPTYKTLAEVEPRIAVNAANTPGDADSLFKITQPGSYYLTGNFTGVSGKNGIEIATSDVTLDLSGMELRGALGTLNGIFVSTAAAQITVRNGTIVLWRGDGLVMEQASDSAIENVQSAVNFSSGFLIGKSCTITRCTAQGNGGVGFFTLGFCTLSGCTARNNSATGFSIGTGSTVTRCTASEGSADGFTIGSGAAATDCVAQGNIARGFAIGSAATVTGCSATLNGSHGFSVGSFATVRQCSASTNGTSSFASGIQLIGTGARIEDNHVTANDNGIGGGGGASANIIIRNSSLGNTSSDYAAIALDDVGPIGTVQSSTNPFANFRPE